MSRLTPEPNDRLSVPIICDPPGILPSIVDANTDKAMGILMGCLAQSPWGYHFDISLPGGTLELDWRRIGSTAGSVVWKWAGQRVAATLILSGVDPDDCLAIERLTHTLGPEGPSLPQGFLKRVRESPRPLVGIAWGDSDPQTHTPIVEFSIGLSKGISNQLRLKQSRPPLGTAIPQDFPPRFFHMLVINGTIKGRRWPDSKAFREIPNLQQVVTTFMDRFEDSYEKFDERILLRHDEGDHLFRVEWTGLLPTAGVAELTDSKQARHKLLLLSGKDAGADTAVIDVFASTLPHFVRGLFDVPLREFKTGPRPVLVELVGVQAEEVDPAAGHTAEALAVAFFRRLGVF